MKALGSIAVLQETQCPGGKAQESGVWGHSLSHPVPHETLSQKEKGGNVHSCQMWWYTCSPSTAVVAQELKVRLGCRVKPYLKFFFKCLIFCVEVLKFSILVILKFLNFLLFYRFLT